MTNLLSDIITYVRRIVKTPSNTVLTDSLIIDYINRFWIIDVDMRLQLFDLKTTYQFQTTPGVDQYNMPLYNVQEQIQPVTNSQLQLAEKNNDGTSTYITDLLLPIRSANPNATLVPGTIQIWFKFGNSISQTLFQDDGNGNITKSFGFFGFTSGTINYNTAVATLNLAAPVPNAGSSVTASFNYVSQAGSNPIAMFPVYQGFEGPAYINGIEMPFYTQRSYFNNLWPNYSQVLTQIGTGNGTSGPYTFTFPFLPQNTQIPNNSISSVIVRGHVDITGIIDTGVNQDPPLDTGNGSLTIPVIPTTSSIPQVYIIGVDGTNTNQTLQDTGVFLSSNQNLGLLTWPGNAPLGNQVPTNTYFSSFSITAATNANPCVLTVSGTANFVVGQTVQINNVSGMTQLNGQTFSVTSNNGTLVTINVDSTSFGVYTGGGTVSSFTNVINYTTGVATNVFFNGVIPANQPILGQCVYYQTGIPRAALFYNNIITLRAPPNTQYQVQLNAFLTPAAFLNTTGAIPFGYMSEYIARGAARKILSDIGDVEQFNFYEPLFKEQELLVWKKSQRIWTATRTQTIYSQDGFPNTFNNSSLGI